MNGAGRPEALIDRSEKAISYGWDGLSGKQQNYILWFMRNVREHVMCSDLTGSY